MLITIDGAAAAIILIAMTGVAAGQGSARPPFSARTAKLTGTILLHAPIDDVFPLFSPLGERKWVGGWNPEILDPRDTDWAEGMVFRTRTDGPDEIWVIAELDAEAHRVVYYRTEPGRLVARVEVRCRALVDGRTEVSTVYSYVGLSEAGNEHIAEWTDSVYRSKMERWEKNINDYLHSVGR